MKIGINALFMIPGVVGGTETYLRQTLLAAVKRYSEHEFIVFTNQENRNTFARDLKDFDNVTLVETHLRARSRPHRVWYELFQLGPVAATQGIDVLWNPGNLACGRMPCAQVTTIHDLQFIRFPEEYPKMERWVTSFLTRHAIRCSDRVLAISEFSRQEIVSWVSMDIDAIPISLEAADTSFSESLSGEFIAERVMTLLHSAEPYLLVVANTYPHKNVETAIRAFSEIADQIPHRLVLLGKPRRGEPAVAAALAESAVRDRIVRIQQVSKTDLVALYQGSDLLVFPSKYEGFGLPVLEAMRAGIPVVSTRMGSIPEVGGDAIEYADADSPHELGQAIVRMTQWSPEERASVIAKARARADRFSWDETARVTVETLLDANHRASASTEA